MQYRHTHTHTYTPTPHPPTPPTPHTITMHRSRTMEAFKASNGANPSLGIHIRDLIKLVTLQVNELVDFTL